MPDTRRTSILLVYPAAGLLASLSCCVAGFFVGKVMSWLFTIETYVVVTNESSTAVESVLLTERRTGTHVLGPLEPGQSTKVEVPDGCIYDLRVTRADQSELITRDQYAVGDEQQVILNDRIEWH